jgi:hypothetical protein
MEKSETVSRWDPDENGQMLFKPTGSFVAWADFNALAAQVLELTTQSDELMKLLGLIATDLGKSQKQLRELQENYGEAVSAVLRETTRRYRAEKAIDTAREKALEEAAKICDGIHQQGSLDAFYLAIAIRALKPQAGGGETKCSTS